MQKLIENMIENGELGPEFSSKIEELEAEMRSHLIMYQDDYKMVVGLEEAPEVEVSSVRKMYSLLYRILESTMNPESVSDRIINHGMEGFDLVDALNALYDFLPEGTKIDLLSVFLEAEFENITDLNIDLLQGDDETLVDSAGLDKLLQVKVDLEDSEETL